MAIPPIGTTSGVPQDTGTQSAWDTDPGQTACATFDSCMGNACAADGCPGFAFNQDDNGNPIGIDGGGAVKADSGTQTACATFDSCMGNACAADGCPGFAFNQDDNGDLIGIDGGDAVKADSGTQTAWSTDPGQTACAVDACPADTYCGAESCGDLNRNVCGPNNQACPDYAFTPEGF